MLVQRQDASHQYVKGVFSRAVITGLQPPCYASLYEYEVQGEASTAVLQLLSL